MLLFARSFYTLWEYAGYDRLPVLYQVQKNIKKRIASNENAIV